MLSGSELAHEIVRNRPGSAQAELDRHRFRALSPKEQLLCRAELDACRRARRGDCPAELA